MARFLSRALAFAVVSLTFCPSLGAPAHGGHRHAAVACEAKVCSDAGIEMIREGGNAADAFVATSVCVGVIGMYHSGLGGGGFMLVRAANGTYDFVDFRECAPGAATQDMFNKNANLSIYGGLATGVPGDLRGLEYLHKHHGKLPWERVFAPAIKLARFGFRVSEDLIRYIGSTSSNGFLVDDPSWAMDFAPSGKLVKLGETMTRKRYADTLETIARKGADAFYTGAIANATITALKAHGGIMTLKDLANYTVVLREPVSINYRGRKLTSTNAPSSGVVALNVLNTIAGYSGFGDPRHVNASTHRLDEAMRWGYGLRTEMADPGYVEGMDAYTKSMITKRTGEDIRAKISDKKTFAVSYYDPAGIGSVATHGTSHIVATDASGLTISSTTSVNLLFGSRVMVPETGVILNDGMNDFSIPGSSNAFGYIPQPINYVAPGKRALSSMSPIIAETAGGDVLFAIGAAGGSRITTSTIQNAIHLIDDELSIAETLARPRLHDQLVPAQLSFEYTYSNETVAYLKGLGSNVTWEAPGGSAAQGLARLRSGVFEAAGEPRQKNSGGATI